MSYLDIIRRIREPAHELANTRYEENERNEVIPTAARVKPSVIADIADEENELNEVNSPSALVKVLPTIDTNDERNELNEVIPISTPTARTVPPLIRVGQHWALRTPDPYGLRSGGDVLELTAVLGNSVGYVFITPPAGRGFCRIVELRQRATPVESA